MNGSSQTVQDNRQYGVPKPPPNIIGLTIRNVGEHPPYDLDFVDDNYSENPGLDVTFHLSGQLDDPVFLFRCDHPCIAVGGKAKPPTSSYTGMFPNTIREAMSGHPEQGRIRFTDPAQMIEGYTVTIRFRSLTKESISLASISPFIEPLRTQ